MATLLLGSNIFPNPQRKPDPWYAAQPGSKEERLVLANASRLFSWYTAFVIRTPQVIPLPLNLPNTDKGDVFTPEETLQHATKLSATDSALVTKFIKEHLKLVEEQAAVLQEWRMTTVFFTNPLVLDNPHDVMEMAGRLELAARVREGVAPLVNYKLYNQDHANLSSVPSSMQVFINSEYERLKSFLGSGERAKLKGVKIKVTDVSREKKLFWMGACLNKTCKEIQLSPLLARAMFMQVIRDDGDIVVSSHDRYIRFGGDRQTLQRGFDADALKRSGEPGSDLLMVLREIPHLYNNAHESFREALDFPLAHEMAHIYLGDGKTTEPNEAACDSAALDLLKRANGKVALGAFEKILNQAIKEGRQDLWGLESESESLEDLKQRVERLKQRIAE